MLAFVDLTDATARFTTDYVLQSRRSAIVDQIRRNRQSVQLVLDGKLIEVSFEQIRQNAWRLNTNSEHDSYVESCDPELNQAEKMARSRANGGVFRQSLVFPCHLAEGAVLSADT